MPGTERLERFKFLFFTILFVPLTFAQSYPDAHVDHLLKNGIASIMEQNYEEAEKTFSYLDFEYPKLPFGKLYLSAVVITKANDLSIPLEMEKISKYLDEAERIIEKNNLISPLWVNYFWGMIHGYRAYSSSLQGKWFSTFSDGINAVNYFENCLKIDSSFNEALIAIGTYKYWKSVKAAWLPFFSDERVEGFQLLSKATQKVSYNFPSGVISLIWVYIDSKKFTSAITLAQDAIKKYPGNRNFKWALAQAYENVDLVKAIETYYELLASYASVMKKNRINEIVLKHKIAQDYDRLGEAKKSLQICNEILLNKKFTDYEKHITEDRLKRVNALRNKLLSQQKEK